MPALMVELKLAAAELTCEGKGGYSRGCLFQRVAGVPSILKLAMRVGGHVSPFQIHRCVSWSPQELNCVLRLELTTSSAVPC